MDLQIQSNQDMLQWTPNFSSVMFCFTSGKTIFPIHYHHPLGYFWLWQKVGTGVENWEALPLSDVLYCDINSCKYEYMTACHRQCCWLVLTCYCKWLTAFPLVSTLSWLSHHHATRDITRIGPSGVKQHVSPQPSPLRTCWITSAVSKKRSSKRPDVLHPLERKTQCFCPYMTGMWKSYKYVSSVYSRCYKSFTVVSICVVATSQSFV